MQPTHHHPTQFTVVSHRVVHGIFGLADSNIARSAFLMRSRAQAASAPQGHTKVIGKQAVAKVETPVAPMAAQPAAYVAATRAWTVWGCTYFRKWQ